MTISGKLYDGSDATGTEIAAVRLTTQRRLAVAPQAGQAKGGDGWVKRFDGADGAIEMRVIAEGHIDVAWVATLYGRQDARTADAYHVLMADDDSHTGSFLVEALDELHPAGDYRRYRLTLLSAGAITYTPA